MKTKMIMVLILCMALMLSACGGKSEPVEKPAFPQATAPATEAPAVEAPVETAPAPAEESFLEEGKVLLDNEYITITLEGEVEESYYVGYELVLENKCDQYVLVTTDSTSIDGFMVYMNMQNSSVSPGKKAKAELVVYTSDESSMVKSIDDLKNIEGVFNLSFNSDGGGVYTGTNDAYPFSIDGRQGESSDGPQASGQVLVDSDMVRITLMGTFDDDYAIGYNMLIENKSDKYVLVMADNTSVDGFMVYLNMQNSSVAPGKSAVAELTAYTSSGDISSLDEFVNVEGVFTISTNTDGGGVYTSTNISYPFGFADANTVSSQQPVASDDIEAPATEPVEVGPAYTEIVLGETISTDDFDFTVNFVELTYELKPQNTSSVYTSYPAEDGKVYIHIDAHYLNKSKKDVCIRDLPAPSADYNDGYCYTGFVVVDDGDNDFDWVSSYVAAEPLVTCHYHGLIECPVIVDETGDPLFITLEIGGITYRYDIR